MSLGAAQVALEPRGGRIGVAFDWGLATQIGVMAVASLVGVPFGGQAMSIGAALGSLVAAGVVFTQGEALRRGSKWARWIQIGANSLLTLGGLVSLPGAVTAVQAGNFWPLYPLVLLLIVSPIEVWLLLQPGSKATYGKLGAAAFRARHSGPWLTGTIAWAVVCGVLQAFAASHLGGN